MWVFVPFLQRPPSHPSTHIQDPGSVQVPPFPQAGVHTAVGIIKLVVVSCCHYFLLTLIACAAIPSLHTDTCVWGCAHSIDTYFAYSCGYSKYELCCYSIIIMPTFCAVVSTPSLCAITNIGAGASPIVSTFKITQSCRCQHIRHTIIIYSYYHPYCVPCMHEGPAHPLVQVQLSGAEHVPLFSQSGLQIAVRTNIMHSPIFF